MDVLSTPRSLLPFYHVFNLRTEHTGNELLMLFSPPCPAAWISRGYTLPLRTVLLGPIPDSHDVGHDELRSRKYNTEQSPTFWDQRASTWSLLHLCQLTLTGVAQNTFMILPTDFPRKSSCKLWEAKARLCSRDSLIFLGGSFIQ